MLKQPNFFHSQLALLKDTPEEFHLSAISGSSFMISSVDPYQSSAFYAYLITKFRKRKLKIILTEFTKIFIYIPGPKESGCFMENP